MLKRVVCVDGHDVEFLGFGERTDGSRTWWARHPNGSGECFTWGWSGLKQAVDNFRIEMKRREGRGTRIGRCQARVCSGKQGPAREM